VSSGLKKRVAEVSGSRNDGMLSGISESTLMPFFVSSFESSLSEFRTCF
jgi:hypothetical protein